MQSLITGANSILGGSTSENSSGSQAQPQQSSQKKQRVTTTSATTSGAGGGASSRSATSNETLSSKSSASTAAHPSSAKNNEGETLSSTIIQPLQPFKNKTDADGTGVTTSQSTQQVPKLVPSSAVVKSSRNKIINPPPVPPPSGSGSSGIGGNQQATSATLKAFSEGTDMIKGFFSGLQKRVVEVFNEDDDFYIPPQSSHHHIRNTTQRSNHGHSSRVHHESAGSASGGGSSARMRVGTTSSSSSSSQQGHHIKKSSNHETSGASGAAKARRKSMLASSSTNKINTTVGMMNADKDNINTTVSTTSGVTPNASTSSSASTLTPTNSVSSSSSAAQQNLNAQRERRRTLSVAPSIDKIKPETTAWRSAIDKIGPTCRDLLHSQRVTYDVHRCLIVGTEIEFMCEGEIVKSIKVGSRAWSTQQRSWIDAADAHVRTKSTTIEEALNLLVRTQNDFSSDGTNTGDGTPRGPGNGIAPQSLEEAAPITNQRPIFRRNKRAWDHPLSKECYRMRFVEVLKQECSALGTEREMLAEKLESIQRAFAGPLGIGIGGGAMTPRGPY